MIKKKVLVHNANGLHARPAQLIAEAADRFDPAGIGGDRGSPDA